MTVFAHLLYHSAQRTASFKIYYPVFDTIAAVCTCRSGRLAGWVRCRQTVPRPRCRRRGSGADRRWRRLVHRQGRVNARLADVGERAGGCGLEHEGNLLWFGWITKTLYILSIVILYMRLVGIIGFRHIRHLRNRAGVATRCRRCYTENGITRAPVLRKVHISRRWHAEFAHQSAGLAAECGLFYLFPDDKCCSFPPAASEHRYLSDSR